MLPAKVKTRRWLTYDRFRCETHVGNRNALKVQIDVATAVPTLTIWGIAH